LWLTSRWSSALSRSVQSASFRSEAREQPDADAPNLGLRQLPPLKPSNISLRCKDCPRLVVKLTRVGQETQ